MISDQAYILHKRQYKESSELVKLLTHNNGIIDVVAKGSRNPKSKLKGQLQPFIISYVVFSGRSNLKTLINCEQSEKNTHCDYINHVSMLYCNELLLLIGFDNETINLIFEQYTITINALKTTSNVSIVLRRFEWQLCCFLGYELSLPGHINQSDQITFSPTNGIELAKADSLSSARSFTKFINDDALDEQSLADINRLMRRIVSHITHGRKIQSRELLK